VDAPHHRTPEVSGVGVVAGAAAACAVIVAALRRRRHADRALPRRDDDVGEVARRRHTNRPILFAAVAGVATLGVAAAGLGATIVGGACIVGVLVSRRRSGERARRQAIVEAMPSAIELLVMCIHVGLTPTQAVGELARLAPSPIRPGFQAVEQRLHRGAGLAVALTALTGHCGPSALALVSALGTAVRDGLPLAPVLDRLTDEANAGRRRAGEAAARRLPVRLSFPLVVCTLPSFVLLAIAPAVLGALSTLRGSAP
jgi:Flp pilus assembly protein TadB